MDWSIFWTAFAALVAAFAALVAVVAVVVNVWQAIKASKQFLQVRYDDARPILIVTDESKIEIQKSAEAPTYLRWNENEQIICVRNAGKGVALHLRGVNYSPEAVAIQDNDQFRLDNSKSQKHWSYWKSDAVLSGDFKELRFWTGPKSYGIAIKDKEGKDHKFNAPSHTPYVYEGELAPRICRVTLTYTDIFHRKHASIFDLVHNSGWQEVAILDNIPQDLEDLQKV